MSLFVISDFVISVLVISMLYCTELKMGKQLLCKQELMFTVDRESGALGSRLTGAGWGGCAVSMVPTNEVMKFLVKVKENFYDKIPSKAALVGTSLFATQPGSGAMIYLPSSS